MLKYVYPGGINLNIHFESYLKTRKLHLGITCKAIKDIGEAMGVAVRKQRILVSQRQNRAKGQSIRNNSHFKSRQQKESHKANSE